MYAKFELKDFPHYKVYKIPTKIFVDMFFYI